MIWAYQGPCTTAPEEFWAEYNNAKKALAVGIENLLNNWNSEFGYHDRQYQKRFHDSSSPRR